MANFKSSDDFVPVLPPPPPKDDALRALTERGHDSVYNKGPASASESNDEITAAPAPLDRLEGLGRPIQREKASMGSLKRASVDVELLAPRSPMGKETMVTFSNTLPRASMNVNGVLGANGGPEEPPQPTQPVQRRLKAVQVPIDPMRSQQLVSEWKQKSMEMRGLSLRDEPEREGSEEGSEVGSVGTDDGGSQGVPVYPPTVQPGRPSANSTTPSTNQHPGGARAVATPRPPQIPEAGPPPVSPKSALTRAKWLAITEKSGAGGSLRGAPNQPRIMQVIAMSKQQGLLLSSSSGETPKSSETTSTSSGTSSMTSADSPHYRPSSEQQREGSAIITVDAHAPHHPVVQAPPPSHILPPSGNGNPWEWRGPPCSDPRDAYELNNFNRGDSAARGSSFRPHQTISPCSSGDGDPEALPPPPLPHGDIPGEGQRRESTMRRKTALVLLDREFQNQTEQENYYKKLHGGRRFKD